MTAKYGDIVTEETEKIWYDTPNNRGTTLCQHKNNRKEFNDMKYVCDVCGWTYDEELGYPEEGIAPGTKWEDLPEDFACPLCSVGKDLFSEA